MSRIFPYKATGMPKFSAYQCECVDANRPCLTALTRAHTAYVELDMPNHLRLDLGEQFVIRSLFEEHHTRGPFAVTPYVAYCQHLRRDALDVVMRRIEAILATKEVAQ